MAGITNAAYRQLCREQVELAGGSGLFVCEMITSRGLVERDPKTLSMLQFDPGETDALGAALRGGSDDHGAGDRDLVQRVRASGTST